MLQIILKQLVAGNFFGIKKLEKIGNRLEDDCVKFFSNMPRKEFIGNLEILNIRIKYRLGFLNWEEAEILIQDALK